MHTCLFMCVATWIHFSFEHSAHVYIFCWCTCGTQSCQEDRKNGSLVFGIIMESIWFACSRWSRPNVNYTKCPISHTTNYSCLNGVSLRRPRFNISRSEANSTILPYSCHLPVDFLDTVFSKMGGMQKRLWQMFIFGWVMGKFKILSLPTWLISVTWTKAQQLLVCFSLNSFGSGGKRVRLRQVIYDNSQLPKREA